MDPAYDEEYLTALCHPHNGLIAHMLAIWKKNTEPCLICADSCADQALTAKLRRQGLSYSAAHGLCDTDGKVTGFFCLFKLPKKPTPHTTYLLELLTPYLYVTLTRMLVEEAKGNTKLKSPIITNREVQILRLVKDGKTTGDIAISLKLSPFTIKNHMRNIFNKLAVRNRTHAVTRAIGLGLIAQE